MGNFKFLAVIFFLLISANSNFAQNKSIEKKIDDLLRQMTPEEKVGQLNQYAGNNKATGPVNFKNDHQQLIQAGKIGAMLNILGSKYTRQYQETAMQSRLKIPLLFGLDVIHGYKVTFPIPLAEASSWDMEAIEKSARISAVEASSAGIHWTFAPMVDIGRDPRWGRVMEGAGEDTYLGSRIAFARVKGFQGNGLGNIDSLMATAKHFAGYGAAIGGRDYNSVDMSERQLWETFLPPFKSANNAGVATFMTGFNDLNGIPATGNHYLLREILKKRWKFQGFVVSDWGSVGEMIAHGYVKNSSDAAFSAITAGTDMDMESNSYRNNLVRLIEEKKVPIALVDEAVRRVLRKKFELGLFDDPFKFSDSERENKTLNNPQHREFAREIAKKSIVLLKNDKQILPLSKDLKTIAFIGPQVKAKKANHGFWAVDIPNLNYDEFIVSQWEGVKNKLGNNTKLLYSQGCEVACKSTEGFSEAVETAKQADLVILSVGEDWNQSGEAKSRSNLQLPGMQEDLIKSVKATGKPIVVLINAGRPLIFEQTATSADAILYTWWLGTEAGNAIADVLFGDYNPSGKLPMTFPRSEGQIPIYYNHFNTGRPPSGDDSFNYVSAYIDLRNSPKFPFGYGLSYTKFQYSNLKLNKKKMQFNDKLEVSLNITNTGIYEGEEVVQLYLRDKTASVVRPIKELKDFRKVALKAGEMKTVKFIIDKEKLSFYNQFLQWVAEAGEFDLMIGSSSADIHLKDSFELIGK